MLLCYALRNPYNRYGVESRRIGKKLSEMSWSVRSNWFSMRTQASVAVSRQRNVRAERFDGLFMGLQF